jgi:hypothetical protein
VTTILRTAGSVLAALVIAGNAHAALIGVATGYPDTTLGNSAMIYNHSGGGAGIGRLTVIASYATLTAASGGASAVQNYGGDTPTADVMLTINVNDLTGALQSGTVSVALGDSTTAAGWTWTGKVTQFGFVDPTKPSTAGTIFDARWQMTADTYQHMPTNMSQFVNNYLAGRNGALDLLSTASWGGTAAGKANFGNDWIYASNPSAVPAAFTAGLSAPILVTSTGLSHMWVTPVPLPGAAWLFLSGLALAAPAVRRRAPV